MIGFTVLGGYLGVGKTTLLNNILRGNLTVDGESEPKRIALLINDFGDINIDAKLIESQTDNQINLANGCVCCTLTDGFTNAIEALLEASPKPDHIIVEASGVADVNNLSQYGHSDELKLASIVVVADAETVREKARDKYVAKTIQRQLKAADLILLNKVDLIDDSQAKSLMTWLDGLTDAVPVAACVKCDVPLALIFDLESRGDTINDDLHAHEQYSSWSFSASGSAVGVVPTNAPQALEAFMQALGADVLRCKGVLVDEMGTTYTLQVVGNRKEIEIHEVQPEPGSADPLSGVHSDSGSPGISGISSTSRVELVAIGMMGKLDIPKLDALAKRLFR